MPKNHVNDRTWMVLALILLVAAALRFYGIGWGIPGKDQPRAYHPDEKMAPLVLSRMKPAEGRFNPAYFINPTLFYYQYGLLLAPVSRLTGITPPWQVKNYIAFTEHDPQEQRVWFLAGRVLTVLMGVITVWGVFWLGCQLSGKGVGLAAAALLAVMPAHVIQSHYMVVDAPAVMWMVLSLGFFVQGLRSLRAAHFALSGLMLGFGMATKYTVVMVVLPQAVLAFQEALESARSGSKRKKGAAGPAGLPGAAGKFAVWCKNRWRWILLWGGLAAAGFFIGCPYSLLDWQTFMGPGGIGGLRNYNVFGFSLFKIFRVSFFYGLGLPLALFVLAGLALVAFRPATRMFAVGVYLLTSMLVLILNASPYMRHFVPLTPFLALCGGYLALELKGGLLPRLPGHARKAALAAGVLIVGYTLIFDMALLRAMTRKDPRTAAAEWIAEKVDTYSLVAVARPEWGEDFYSVSIDKTLFSHVVTGFEYRLVEVYKPDYIILTEYDSNDYLQAEDEKDFNVRLKASADYSPVAEFRRKNSFLGVPVCYRPPGMDWLYFHPEITIYGRSEQDSSRLLYLEGRKLQAKGDNIGAEKLLARCAQLDKNNPLYLYWLAFNRAMIFNQLVGEGKTEVALKLLEETGTVLDQALKVHPRAWQRVELAGISSQLKMQEGLGLIKAQQPAKARGVLSYARQIKLQQKVVMDSLSNVTLSNWDSDYNDILLLLAESCLRSGDESGATPVLIELLKRDSSNKQALLALGNIFLRDPGKHAQALRIFQRALSLYPDLATQGNIKEVVGDLERELSASRRRPAIQVPPGPN